MHQDKVDRILRVLAQVRTDSAARRFDITVSAGREIVPARRVYTVARAGDGAASDRLGAGSIASPSSSFPKARRRRAYAREPTP